MWTASVQKTLQTAHILAAAFSASYIETGSSSFKAHIGHWIYTQKSSTAIACSYCFWWLKHTRFTTNVFFPSFLQTTPPYTHVREITEISHAEKKHGVLFAFQIMTALAMSACILKSMSFSGSNSLGILFWTLLVGKGQMPFEGTPMELLHAIAQKRPMPVHEFRRDIPQVLAMIIEKVRHVSVTFNLRSSRSLASFEEPRYAIQQCIWTQSWFTRMPEAFVDRSVISIRSSSWSQGIRFARRTILAELDLPFL